MKDEGIQHRDKGDTSLGEQTEDEPPLSLSGSISLFFRLLMCKNVQEQLSTPQIPRSQWSATGLVLNGATRRDRDDRDLNGKQLDMNELERLFPASPSQEQQEKGITVSPAGWEHTWLCIRELSLSLHCPLLSLSSRLTACQPPTMKPRSPHSLWMSSASLRSSQTLSQKIPMAAVLLLWLLTTVLPMKDKTAKTRSLLWKLPETKPTAGDVFTSCQSQVN